MALRHFGMALLAAQAPVLPALGQQTPARIELPRGFEPRYPEARGFRILVDEAHHNFHTAGGTYGPFAWLASRDGHLIGRNTDRFTRAMLDRAQILVIAGARRRGGVSGDAFTPAEIDILLDWIEQGGSLLLVVDHAPFPDHVADLTERLGIRVLGDASKGSGRSADLFEAGRGTLPANEVVCAGAVERVRSFRGSALQGPDGAIPLLRLDQEWRVNGSRIVGDAAQAVAFRRGRGRVVVVGEAAMLTSQLNENDRSMGIGARWTEGNVPFVLSILQWLGSGEPCDAARSG